MEKEGIFLLFQVDHLTGEDIGWALEALRIPGIRNQSLIPTVTKKGRMGYLVMLDIEPYAEAEVARIIFESFATHGYHRIQTRHVFERTVIEEASLVFQRGEKSLRYKVHLKRRVEKEMGPYFLESDDLFALQKQIYEELGVNVSALELRRQIEFLAKAPLQDPIYIAL